MLYREKDDKYYTNIQIFFIWVKNRKKALYKSRYVKIKKELSKNL